MKSKRNGRKSGKFRFILILAIAAALAFAGFSMYKTYIADFVSTNELADLEYDGSIAVEVSGNLPGFTDEDLERAEKEDFEEYSELDEYGRCGSAWANIGWDMMPHGGERESLSSVTPSGWQRIGFWTRSHLIGYQLAGEQANPKNLITGSYRMNSVGMLEYENMVASYIRTGWGRHVLYRVTPVYKGRELVARGVQMEARSLGDNGKGICFNVFVFNIEPGYIINYSDGTIKKDLTHVTTVHLRNKFEKFSGHTVQIGDADVQGSTGEVKYIYYIDKVAKTKTNQSDGAEYDGAAPSERGVYYVRAVVEGDDWYPSGTSNVARLNIM